MPDPIETFRKEWPAIRGAPWSFVILGVVLVALTWGFFVLIHGAENAGKDATIESLRQEVTSYKDKLSGATPEEAKAKIADLEARLAKIEPRRLVAEQRQTILSILMEASSRLGTVTILLTHDMSCADCTQYAADFAETLTAAHWKFQPAGALGTSFASPKGVTILTLDPAKPLPEAKALVDALTAAKIQFDVIPGPLPQPDRPNTDLMITPRSAL